MLHLVGKRIRLIEMDDPHDPIPAGSTGEVTSVVEFQNGYHLNMKWDKSVNRSLSLVCPPDKVAVIEEITRTT